MGKRAITLKEPLKQAIDVHTALRAWALNNELTVSDPQDRLALDLLREQIRQSVSLIDSLEMIPVHQPKSH